jgi:predicted nucleic acid-binding protein
VYFDSSYVIKFYLNEPESLKIRQMVQNAGFIRSSLWTLAEFHSALHRNVREGLIPASEARVLSQDFFEHIETGVWELVPVNRHLLERVSARLLSAPKDVFLRAADAFHLTTAADLGEPEVWSSDRHMLAAASHFGVTGRSV